MRRLFVVLLATSTGLFLGALFLLRPYIDRPALMQDPFAVSDAFADVAVLSLAMDARGVDLLAAPEPSTFRPYQPDWPLCSASALAFEPYPPEVCRPVRAVYTRDCRNVRGCVTLRVDPSVLREAALAGPLLEALTAPCDALARASARSPGGLGRAVVGLHDSPAADISQLHCDRGRKIHPKSVEADGVSGSIRIDFE